MYYPFSDRLIDTFQTKSYLDQELEDLKVDLELARTRRYYDNEVY